jgi:hypothetical protein
VPDLARARVNGDEHLGATPIWDEGVLDANSLVFTRNHIFENWTQAVGVVSGKGSYSGGYRWQLPA